MNLTHEDLQAIRDIVKNEVAVVVRATLKEELAHVYGELEALRNDIKEIYGMIVDLQKGSIIDNSFQKLSVEKKLLKLHAELLEAARQAGVTLPNH